MNLLHTDQFYGVIFCGEKLQLLFFQGISELGSLGWPSKLGNFCLAIAHPRFSFPSSIKLTEVIWCMLCTFLR